MSPLPGSTHERATQWIATGLKAAAELALQLDRLAGNTKTTIEVEPEGFLVVVETARGNATGIGAHAVREPVAFATALDFMARDTTLLAGIGRAHDRMRSDIAEYQQRKREGRLTRL